MLSIDSTELIYLVLGPGVILLVAILLRLDFRLKARCDELESRLTQAEGRLAVLQHLENEDSRERYLEERLDLLTQQQEQLMTRDAEAGPYFNAVRLAEGGADIEALMEQTGVTKAEAELIVSLHGKYQEEADADQDPDQDPEPTRA